LPFAINHPQVRQLAHACLDAVLTPFNMANGHALIGASVGVSQALGKDDFDTALARADEAMYRIKKNGKRGVAFDPAMSDPF